MLLLLLHYLKRIHLKRAKKEARPDADWQIQLQH